MGMNPVTAYLLLCATWNMGMTQMLLDMAEGWDL